MLLYIIIITIIIENFKGNFIFTLGTCNTSSSDTKFSIAYYLS